MMCECRQCMDAYDEEHVTREEMNVWSRGTAIFMCYVAVGCILIVSSFMGLRFATFVSGIGTILLLVVLLNYINENGY